MNLTLLAIGLALLAVAASAVLVARFSRHAASVSEKRMMLMLTCAGVDSRFSGHDDAWAILQVARVRCSSCRSADLCDRWLAGKAKGDNSFCQNAQISRILKRITWRIAGSTPSGYPARATSLTPGARNVVRAGAARDASLLLSPSIHSPIAAVL